MFQVDLRSKVINVLSNVHQTHFLGVLLVHYFPAENENLNYSCVSI